MIASREVVLTSSTTVSDLYDWLDIPRKITKKASVSHRTDFRSTGSVLREVLRLEWEVEDDDPAV